MSVAAAASAGESTKIGAEEPIRSRPRCWFPTTCFTRSSMGRSWRRSWVFRKARLRRC